MDEVTFNQSVISHLADLASRRTSQSMGRVSVKSAIEQVLKEFALPQLLKEVASELGKRHKRERPTPKLRFRPVEHLKQPFRLQ